jgi:hypothetical protein
MKEVLAVLYRYEGPFLDGEDADRPQKDKQKHAENESHRGTP